MLPICFYGLSSYIEQKLCHLFGYLKIEQRSVPQIDSSQFIRILHRKKQITVPQFVSTICEKYHLFISFF